MHKLDCMADLWLFSQLPAAHKAMVQSFATRRAFRKGDMLFGRGDRASAVFLVTEGRVRLFKTFEDGKEVTLGYLTPHDLFGEEVLFTDTVRSMSAQALESTRLCVCEKDDLERLIREHPNLATSVIRALAVKLEEATDRLASAAVQDVRERVASSLARLAREYGQQTAQGFRLDFRLTHEDLGSLVGASRVMVTNVLRDLRRAGLVSTDESRRFVVKATLLARERGNGGSRTDPSDSPCPCFGRASAD